MTYWDRKLVREQLDRKLEKLKVLADLGIERGWVRMIREALGMSSAQLGERVGIDQSRISRLESAESTGDLKLSSLRKIADALDMKFVYGFVPKDSLEEMVRQRAQEIALERMKRLDHTMRLEDQELSGPEKEKLLHEMIQRIMIEEPKEFWNR